MYVCFLSELGTLGTLVENLIFSKCNWVPLRRTASTKIELGKEKVLYRVLFFMPSWKKSHIALICACQYFGMKTKSCPFINHITVHVSCKINQSSG